MELNSPQPKSTRLRPPLESQIRECFGRVAYSHKTHEKCADKLTSRLAHVKLLQIILSAITTGGLIAVIFGGEEMRRSAAIISAVVSTALLALNTYTKDSDPGQKAERHKEVASRLWDIRESYLSLLTDLRTGAPDSDARTRRDALQSRLAKIYETAPRTDAKSYAKAQEGLQHSEELSFSDEELDQLLPPALRG
jgi:SMODS and SLOG-associating 2TM effector domain family 4